MRDSAKLLAAGLAMCSAIGYVLLPNALTVGTARDFHGSQLDDSQRIQLQLQERIFALKGKLTAVASTRSNDGPAPLTPAGGGAGGCAVCPQAQAGPGGGDSDGRTPGSTGPGAVTTNILDGREYLHHPVMLEAMTGPYPVDPVYLTEWNGLKIPAGFDCDMFYHTLPGNMANPKGDHWGHHRYFYEVPSRWYACWLHKTNLESGYKMARSPQLIVDDEYHEQVAIYQSVLRARGHLVVGELGGRWGTWGARAIAFAKARRPDLTYTLYDAEAATEHCEGMRHVMEVNDIEFTQLCDYVNATNFLAWLATVDHVDVLDIDIQSAEFALLGDPEVMDAIAAKVYRIVVGSHPRGRRLTHQQLVDIFVERKWHFIWNVKDSSRPDAVRGYLRGRYDPKSTDRFNWTALLESNAFHSTPRGPVANFDGEIIVDNPRFVHADKLFSMADTVLKIDDLKPFTR